MWGCGNVDKTGRARRLTVNKYREVYKKSRDVNIQ